MNNQTVIELEAFTKIYTRHEDLSLTLQIVCRSCNRELLHKNYGAINDRTDEMTLDEILVSCCLNKDIKGTLAGLVTISLRQLFKQKGTEIDPIELRIRERLDAQFEAIEDARMDRESDLSLRRMIKSARTDEERFLIRKVFGIL